MTDAPTRPDEPVTIGERYSSAIESSNLKVVERRRGDVDYLIAAASQGDALPSLLMRLHMEYDGVRADMKRAKTPTDRMLTLIQLKTRGAAREALGNLALLRARSRYPEATDQEVLRLSRRVLDLHLEPLCWRCDGRGFNGGAHRGEMQQLCRPCHGSGQRRDELGKDQQSQAFGRYLLIEMESVLWRAGWRMKRKLSSDIGDAVLQMQVACQILDSHKAGAEIDKASLKWAVSLMMPSD